MDGKKANIAMNIFQAQYSKHRFLWPEGPNPTGIRAGRCGWLWPVDATTVGIGICTRSPPPALPDVTGDDGRRFVEV